MAKIIVCIVFAILIWHLNNSQGYFKFDFLNGFKNNTKEESVEGLKKEKTVDTMNSARRKRQQEIDKILNQ